MRKYNCIPDTGDHRDLRFAKLHAPAPTLPSSVDLRPQCSPIVDQGQIGSCTGNSIAGAFEYLELKEMQQPGTQPEEFGAAFAAVSRLFIYYNERLLEGTVGQDAGAMIRDGIKTLVKFGACTEATWNYSESLLYRKPSKAAYAEASKHKVTQYMRVDDLAGIKQCLAAGYPVVIGFTVYESFESAAVAQTGMMPMPAPDESALGGHAVLVVGYDDARQCLVVRNSWGTSWGDKGYFYMPYAFASHADLVNDMWTVRL